MKKTMMGLCIMLALAVTPMTTLGTAGAAVEGYGKQKQVVILADYDTPLAGGAFSDPLHVPDQTGDQTVVPEIVNETAETPTDGLTSDPETDAGAPQVQPHTLDMAQFIPNKDYGLFLCEGDRRLNLDGATLALGREYTLAVRFLIDAPVLANAEYTYWLPEILAGYAGTAERTFSSADGAIATCALSGNKFGVVFTAIAQELSQNGNDAFLLEYTFKQKLNEDVAGDDTSYRLTVPVANGSETIEFQINRIEEATEATETPAVTAAPEVQPEAEPEETEGEADTSAEPEAELICGLEEGDGHEHSDVCYAAGEATAEQAAAGREIVIERVLPRIVRSSSTYKMIAKLSGFEDTAYTIQWQVNAGEAWLDYHGTGESIDVSVEEYGLDCDWRVVVATLAAADTEEPSATDAQNEAVAASEETAAQ